MHAVTERSRFLDLNMIEVLVKVIENNLIEEELCRKSHNILCLFYGLNCNFQSQKSYSQLELIYFSIYCRTNIFLGKMEQTISNL